MFTSIKTYIKNCECSGNKRVIKLCYSDEKDFTEEATVELILLGWDGTSREDGKEPF